MRRILLTCCLLLSFALSVAATRGETPVAQAPLLHVYSCQVLSGSLLPKSDEIGLAVRFENDSPAPYSSIVWRAMYRNVAVDFIDDGTFAPKTQIDNYLLFEGGSTKILWFNVLADVIVASHGLAPNGTLTKTDLTFGPFASTPFPENCTIVRATDADGHLWLNPAVPQDATHALPTPTPYVAMFHKPADLAPQPKQVVHDSGPISIEHCTLGVDVKRRLQITYRSIADRPADTITFRARYATSALDFTDTGTFSQGVDIVHWLRADTPEELKHVNYLGYDDPFECSVVSVHYTDGTSWQNTELSASPPPLPTTPPNAIDIATAHAKWIQRHAYPTPLPTQPN